jgi:hypothetical protein
VRYFKEDGFSVPDENINFNWYMYPEAGNYQGQADIEKADKSIAFVRIPDNASGKQIHIILEVKDNDKDAPLTSYRRIVMNVE